MSVQALSACRLGARLAIDPIALRLKNYAERDPERRVLFSSKSLLECYARRRALLLGEAKSGPRLRPSGRRQSFRRIGGRRHAEADERVAVAHRSLLVDEDDSPVDPIGVKGIVL